MSETRQHLVDEANRLIAERSYNGFSYADLSASLGIRKPSIHYHFPKKQDLVIAVVQSYARGFGHWVQRVAARSPAEQLEAYFELFEGFVARGHGCPTSTLTAEFGTLPDVVAGELHRLMVSHVDWLSGVLERGRERCEFRFEGSAPDVARLVASTVQGAVLSARALGLEVYRQIVGRLTSLLNPPT